jgi:hypothetical protein
MKLLLVVLTYCHDIIKNIKCMIMVTLDVGLEVLARKAFEKYTC